MQLTNLTDAGYLFQVEDVFPSDLVEKINSIDWANAPYTKMDSEKGIPYRRHLNVDLSLAQEVHTHIRNVLVPQIESECNIKFHAPEYTTVKWWVDEPGFKSEIYPNNEDLASALQVYWGTTDLSGSAFYQGDAGDQLIKRFSSTANSGYLMLNSHEPVKLWHKMEQAVPDNQFGISIFLSFGPYTKL